MNKIRTNYETITKLPIITFSELNQITKYKYNSQKNIISRALKNKQLIQLKKGYFVSPEFLKLNSEGYKYFVANQIYSPSYISLQTALDFYGILSETAFQITNVTVNKTYTLTNDLGIFIYKNIKSELFTGYTNIKIGNFEIYFATKAKAVFDFFWYNKKKLYKLTREEIEELRLNLDILNQKDLEELENYIKLSKSKKMEKIFNIILKICEK